MRNLIDGLKPAASARLHLLLAATMWTVVGSMLTYFGARWTLSGKAAYAPAPLLLALATALGALKARYVLDRSARRIAERIGARGDGRCLGGFVSLQTWVLIALMATAGRLLRGGIASRTIVGFIYVAVGTALLLGSLRLWHAWYNHRSRVRGE